MRLKKRMRQYGVKVAAAGCRPTAEEVEQHMQTHLPFRSWCPHCVKAKARGATHRLKSGKDENELPTIMIDYMFFRYRR